jgi:hypothetical protein
MVSSGMHRFLFFFIFCSAGVGQVPVVKVDPSWPQPLPNGWGLGQVCGTALGAQDHLYY